MMAGRSLAVAAAPLLAAALALAVPSTPTTPAAGGYAAEIQKWREQREARLKANGGWLTVAGLYWLKDGENRFGADPSCEVVLPPGSAPAVAGVIVFHDGKTTVKVEPGVTVTAGGKPVATMDLKDESTGSPDVLTLGPLMMHVIKRGDRYAIRLKDMNSRFRKEFTGLHWFPIKESYRVTARWEPHDPPRQIAVPTILGTTEMMPSPGRAVFTINGQELKLDPVLEEPDSTELFIIFKDLTSGKETYPAGRFLYAETPTDGVLVLDFNKAYNPPCAFTPYATCPLPPEQNRLPVRIDAGEQNYGQH